MAIISISDLKVQEALVNAASDFVVSISLISGGSGTVSLTPTRTKPPHYDPPYYELDYSDVKIT
jgi:hypothetical protein